MPIGPEPAGAATHQSLVDALAGPVRSLPEGDRPEDWTGPREEADLTAAERALEGAQAARQAAPERPMSYEIRFTASQQYVDLLDEALGLLGEPRKAARLPEVQLRALRDLVERLRKRRTGRRAAPARETAVSGGKPRSDRPGAAPERERAAYGGEARSDAPGAAPQRRTDAPLEDEGAAPQRVAAANGGEARSDAPARRRRTVPVAVRRSVWNRDEARCAYVDERGQRCRETHRLEVHHVRAFGLGGPHTVDNLELRCRAHNDLAAEEDFGRESMRRIRGARHGTIGTANAALAAPRHDEAHSRR